MTTITRRTMPARLPALVATPASAGSAGDDPAIAARPMPPRGNGSTGRRVMSVAERDGELAEIVEMIRRADACDRAHIIGYVRGYFAKVTRPKETVATVPRQIGSLPDRQSDVGAKELPISNFDRLPDAAIVHPKLVSALLGISTRTLRRSPPFPKVRITERRYGFQVGAVRQFIHQSTAS